MTGDSLPGSGSPDQDARPELRVSHADRDRVVETLTAAAGEGRLAAAELDDRVGATLSARTRGELAALTADLPPSGVERQVKDLVRIDTNAQVKRQANVERPGVPPCLRRSTLCRSSG